MNTLEGLTIRWQPWTVPAILGHLWQSSIVGLAILILMFAARRAPARTRWTIGWIGLMKFMLPLVWFAPTFSRLSPPSLDSWRGFPASALFSGGSSSDAPLPGGTNFSVFAFASRDSWVELGAAIWGAGALLLIGGWFLRGYRFRRGLLAGAEPISSGLAARVEWASARVGLAKAPRCVAVGGDTGPGVIGVFSTVVVLPRSLESSLSPAEIDSVLIHEFTHLRRRDALLEMLQAVVVRLFWFDPVVWLLNRSLHVEMEKSCDEAVLDVTAEAKIYAGSILKMVRQSLGIRSPGFAGATGVPVVARVKNILAQARTPHLRRPRLAVVGTAAALVAFSAFSGAIQAGIDARPPGGKVLVLRNIAPSNRIPDFEAVLGDLGYALATKDSAEMATTDLSQYRLIVIPGTQWQTGYYADFAKAAERFDRFVQSGGTLLLELNGTEGEGAAFPGGGAPARAEGAADGINQAQLNPKAAHLVFLNQSIWNK